VQEESGLEGFGAFWPNASLLLPATSTAAAERIICALIIVSSMVL